MLEECEGIVLVAQQGRRKCQRLIYWEVPMKLEELAREIGAHLETTPASDRDEIQGVYAGDRMSDLLAAATEHTLLVTHIANRGLLSLIELMDIPAVCLVNGAVPEAAVLEAARDACTGIMVSPRDLYETCGRLYGVLADEKNRAAPS